MNDLLHAMLPELVLMVAACALFLLGTSSKRVIRRLFVPLLAAGALVASIAVITYIPSNIGLTLFDPWGTFRVFDFQDYVKWATALVGLLLLLLAWPTNEDGSGNAALDYGRDGGEFFGLMLFSLAGVMLVSGADDLMLLFLGIELTSIPTYIMVSISRPLPAAQEAGVKYFFLGAMSAALMLFGFSYLYGTTGVTSLTEIGLIFEGTVDGSLLPKLTPWQELAALMVIAALAFKIAAVPLHFYVGDVYQGAATPVTAFLAFVPKAAGMVALVKIVLVFSGRVFAAPPMLQSVLWVLAILTMTVGNVLGLLQYNVKRTLAYSSVAHSGYMLVGLVTMVTGDKIVPRRTALFSVLFYLLIYGLMNVAAFGVLILLPGRRGRSGSATDGPSDAVGGSDTAETFEDIAGAGRAHPALGLAMAVACFSLTGLPLTVGFFGKLYLMQPALRSGMYGLVIIMMINAAISAAYYLKIVAAMFLRPAPDVDADRGAAPVPAALPWPVLTAVTISAGATVLLGTILPMTNYLTSRAVQGSHVEGTYKTERPYGSAPRAPIIHRP